jgi:UDP:flavonoid glycosyltransferase YjiC (YdhE family)
MGYVLFVGQPFYGHLSPLLLQAAELTRRGWRTGVATTSEGMRHLERRPAGVGALDLGSTGLPAGSGEELAARLSAERFGVGLLLIARALNRAWPAIYDGLVEEVGRERPDLIVVDYAAYAGVDAAEALGVPFVVNNADLLTVLPTRLLPPTASVPPPFSGRSIATFGRRDRLVAPIRRWSAALLERIVIERASNALRASRALPPVRFDRRLRDRLVIVNSAFGLEYPRPLPPLIQMTGPMLPDDDNGLPGDLAAWLDEGDPVVYVSMGTLARPTDDLLATLVAGLTSARFRALWPLRPEVRAGLPAALPARIRTEGWVPSPLTILRHPNVRAFLTHCGTNSVQESLAAGTPIVGLPMFGAQDDMAWRAVDAGVGLRLEKHRVGAAELRGAIEQVIHDESFRRRTSAIQSSFALAGGVGRAADLIENAARFGTSHLRERRGLAAQ